MTNKIINKENDMGKIHPEPQKLKKFIIISFLSD